MIPYPWFVSRDGLFQVSNLFHPVVQVYTNVPLHYFEADALQLCDIVPPLHSLFRDGPDRTTRHTLASRPSGRTFFKDRHPCLTRLRVTMFFRNDQSL